MRAWGLQQSCVLCGERDETRDHIFFACPYSFTVWNNLAGRLSGYRTDPDWEITLQFLTNNDLQYLDKILLKLVFQTSIYHIWQERNKRRHHTGYRSVDQLIRLIWLGLLIRQSGTGYRLCDMELIINLEGWCKDGSKWHKLPDAKIE